MAPVDHEDVATVELTTVEQRVIGSLMEKQVTVPATYPMTLNALRTACNQSTSRDPVVAYEFDAPAITSFATTSTA